jgi:hypothetical protein
MKLVLTAEDKHCALWKKLVAHWTEKIETVHRLNEGDQPELMTAKMRGQIKEIRANLALAKDPITE